MDSIETVLRTRGSVCYRDCLHPLKISLEDGMCCVQGAVASIETVLRTRGSGFYRDCAAYNGQWLL